MLALICDCEHEVFHMRWNLKGIFDPAVYQLFFFLSFFSFFSFLSFLFFSFLFLSFT
jgi:hypothetical protein